MASRHGLGRGLAALLSVPPAEPSSDMAPAGQAAALEIPIEAIEANPNQPRKDFDDNALDNSCAITEAIGRSPAGGGQAQGGGPLPAGGRRTALARGEACRPEDDPRDRQGGRRSRDTRAGPCREPPARGPEPDRGGRGLPAVAGRVRVDTGAAGRAGRQGPEQRGELPAAPQAPGRDTGRPPVGAARDGACPRPACRWPPPPSSSGCGPRSSSIPGPCERPRRGFSEGASSRRAGRRAALPSWSRSRRRSAGDWRHACESWGRSSEAASKSSTPPARSWTASRTSSAAPAERRLRASRHASRANRGWHERRRGFVRRRGSPRRGRPRRRRRHPPGLAVAGARRPAGRGSEVAARRRLSTTRARWRAGSASRTTCSTPSRSSRERSSTSSSESTRLGARPCPAWPATATSSSGRSSGARAPGTRRGWPPDTTRASPAPRRPAGISCCGRSTRRRIRRTSSGRSHRTSSPAPGSRWGISPSRPCGSAPARWGSPRPTSPKARRSASSPTATTGRSCGGARPRRSVRDRSSTARASSLGQHAGLPNYTVGQRRGLGLASTRPLYVTRLDPATNTVVVGAAAEVDAPGPPRRAGQPHRPGQSRRAAVGDREDPAQPPPGAGDHRAVGGPPGERLASRCASRSRSVPSPRASRSSSMTATWCSAAA